MKENVLKNFIDDSQFLCEKHNIKISGVRQEYYAARPFVSFWVDSKVITSVTFRLFKQGVKYSVVVDENFSELFLEKFGEADKPVGNKTYSNTWSTYNFELFIYMIKKFI